MCYCCDMLCMFSLLTCCGCRDRVTRSLIFFPPPASYEIVEQTPESAENAHSRTSKKERRESKPSVQLRMKPRYETRTVDNDRVDEWKEFNCKPSDFHTVVLNTRKGESIPAYFISHPELTDIGLMRCHLMDMRSVLSVNIMAFEYSGYGTSTGKASESNTYADVESAYHYLTQERGISPTSIVCYGQSLGTAVCVHLANHFEVAGIILHSPLMSCLRVLEPFDRTFWFDAYPVIEQIQNVFVPVFVIHGKDDKQIPMVHGEILSKLAPNMPIPPFFVENAGHNDIELVARDELYARIDGFLMKIAEDAHEFDLDYNNGRPSQVTLPLTAENLSRGEYNSSSQFNSDDLMTHSQQQQQQQHHPHQSLVAVGGHGTHHRNHSTAAITRRTVSSPRLSDRRQSTEEIDADETSGLLRKSQSSAMSDHRGNQANDEEKRASKHGLRSDRDNSTTLSDYEDLSGTDQRPPEGHIPVSEVGFGTGDRGSYVVGSVDTSPTHNSAI